MEVKQKLKIRKKKKRKEFLEQICNTEWQAYFSKLQMKYRWQIFLIVRIFLYFPFTCIKKKDTIGNISHSLKISPLKKCKTFSFYYPFCIYVSHPRYVTTKEKCKCKTYKHLVFQRFFIMFCKGTPATRECFHKRQTQRVRSTSQSSFLLPHTDSNA